MNKYKIQILQLNRHFYDPVNNFGVECGEGWYKLILDCHSELLALDPDYKILQIKEKFNNLRYYITTTKKECQKEMYDITHRYEAMSRSTPEHTIEQTMAEKYEQEIDRLNRIITEKTAEIQYYQSVVRESY